MVNQRAENKYRYFIKNLLLFAIGSFVPKLLGFILIPIYTGVLSAEEYGISDLISTTSQLAVPIFSLTIYDAVLRYALDKKCDPALVLSTGIKVSGIGFLILSAITAIVVYGFRLVKPIYALFFVLTYFISTFNNVFSVFLRGLDKVNIIMISGLCNSCITFAANILFLVVLKGGLNEYLLANLIGGVVALLIELFFGKIYRYITLKDNAKLRKEMIAFSAPMVFSAIAWWINNASDRYIITWIAGVAVSGIYAIAGKIPSIITAFQSVFSQAWSISAIKEFDKDDSDGFVGKMYTMFGFGMIAIASLTIILNIPFAKLLYSNEFYEAWKFVPPLVVAGALNALALFTGSIFMAIKDTKSRMISTLLGAGVNTILNFILIRFWGAYGAATATLIGFFVSYIYQEIRIRKHIAIKMNHIRAYLSVGLLLTQMSIAIFANKFIYIQIIIFVGILIMHLGECRKIFLSLIGKLKRKEQVE